MFAAIGDGNLVLSPVFVIGILVAALLEIGKNPQQS